MAAGLMKEWGRSIGWYFSIFMLYELRDCLGQVLPTPVQTLNDLLLEKQILPLIGSNSDVVHVIVREN